MIQTNPASVPESRLRHCLGALAHTVSPRAWHWRQVLKVRQADAVIAPAAKVAVSVTLVLLAGGMLGFRNIAGLAALGALNSAFCRYEPYPLLARRAAFVGACLAASIGFGAWLGAAAIPSGLQVAALAVAAGIAALALMGLRIAGPGPVIMIFAAAAGAGFAHRLTDVGTAVAASAVGSAVGWLVVMAPGLWLPLGPARLAATRAIATATKLGHDGGPSPAAAAGAIAQARLTLGWSARRRSTAWHRHRLARLLDETEAAIAVWTEGQDPAPLRRLARHETALRKIRRYVRRPAGAAAPNLPGIPRQAGLLRDSLRSLGNRDLLLNAARTTISSAVAGWAALALGLGHPLWASMGAMAALQGLTFHATLQRGIQRLVGNVLGAAIAAGLIVLGLDYWQSVAAIVLLQAAAELLVIRNYLLLSMAITPMALVLTGLGSSITTAAAVSRMGDTLVGVFAGIVVAAVTISLSDRHHLLVRQAA